MPKWQIAWLIGLIIWALALIPWGISLHRQSKGLNAKIRDRRNR
jgi:hypothetical protein